MKEVNNTLQNVEVVCEGSSFVFAVGFKWFLVPGNGNEVQTPIPDGIYLIISILNNHNFKFVDLWCTHAIIKQAQFSTNGEN